MHGGFATFDTIVDVPFIARHARHPRDVVRRTLGLPLDQPLVLSSFGGYGVSGLDVDRARLPRLVRRRSSRTGALETRSATRPRASTRSAKSQLYGSGLRYEDLVAASDIVATKPGYGIIAECIANETAILYTSRGHFVEYDVLVEAMPRYLRCGFIDHQDLFAGRWRAALDRVMASPPPAPTAPDKRRRGDRRDDRPQNQPLVRD